MAGSQERLGEGLPPPHMGLPLPPPKDLPPLPPLRGLPPPPKGPLPLPQHEGPAATAACEPSSSAAREVQTHLCSIDGEPGSQLGSSDGVPQ
jgi:hypothetical protein